MKGLALKLIFPLAYSSVFFTFVPDPSSQQILCAIAVHLAYIIAVCISKPPQGRSDVVYRYPLLSVIWSYFMLAFLSNGIMMAVPFAALKWPVLANLLLFLAFCAAYLALSMFHSASEGSEKRDRENLCFIKMRALELNGLLGTICDSEKRKIVERLYDNVRNQSVMSSAKANRIEEQIASCVHDLIEHAKDMPTSEVENRCMQISALLNSRERTLQAMR